MGIKKRYICFLVIVIFISMFSTALASSLNDIEGHRFQVAIERMNYLRILIGDESSNFNPNNTLVRAEAAKVAAMLSGRIESDADLALTALGSEKVFTDVSADMPKHCWALAWIKLVSDDGYIVGDGTGNFVPEGTLTMQEWVTILIRILGHEEPEMAWPSAYIDLAVNIGITEGVDFNGTSVITRAEMARISVNALDSVKNIDGALLSEVIFGEVPDEDEDIPNEGEDEVDRIVVFEDAEFERLVRLVIGIENNPIYTSNLREISTLYIVGNTASMQEIDLDSYTGEEPIKFSTLADISKLTNLNTLHINFKEIDDLTGIGNLASLKTLNLSQNNIKNLAPLQELRGLTSLNLSFNNISSIRPLRQLVKIEILEAAGNNISNISHIRSNINLESLDFSFNNISNVAPLNQLTKLKELKLVANDITCILEFRRLENLETLKLTQNKIEDISTLINLKNLKSLDISFNQIGRINALRNLNKLSFLSLSNNKIADVEPLSKLTGLRILFLGNNSITDRTPLRFLINTSILW
ncbi:MAG: leucine-rich repeat domain-containing protein [Alkaliphilus sp.]